MESLTLVAKLHREVWISGGSIFVDIEIANQTNSHVKKLCISLERDILLYRQCMASGELHGMTYPRIFEERHQTTISNTRLERPEANAAFPARSSRTRMYALEVPKGEITVPCGKYFEVAYSLLVSAALSGSKHITVKLPVFLIHLNSLDIIPNSAGTVTRDFQEQQSCEHGNQEQSMPMERGRSIRQKPDCLMPRRHPRSSSAPDTNTSSQKVSKRYGRSFVVPRQQFLPGELHHEAQLDEIRQSLDASPRKHVHRLRHLGRRHSGENIRPLVAAGPAKNEPSASSTGGGNLWYSSLPSVNRPVAASVTSRSSSADTTTIKSSHHSRHQENPINRKPRGWHTLEKRFIPDKRTVHEYSRGKKEASIQGLGSVRFNSWDDHASGKVRDSLLSRERGLSNIDGTGNYSIHAQDDYAGWI